ncbi:MAG: cation:proton antiporter [Nanoarchaeota archaeon]|nr:cation:proton antiporter [Nanoarchaeota archaeon]
MENVFADIGIMIVVASVLGYIAQLLRQPKIPAYIIAGILVGPILHIVRNVEIIEILAEIGIAFLLFGVGIELNLKKLKYVGKLASLGSVIHVIILFVLGLILALAIGYGNVTAVYIGLILAFSSTMVVIKLLSDKNELDSLHGRIIIAALLVQDIVAIFALSMLNNLQNFAFLPIFISILQAIVVIAVALLCSRLIFPRLFRFAAKSSELLFLMSISVCFIFALLFAEMGFSIIIGAFVAGVALGNLPYNVEIMGKIRPLKDFFGVLFFASIGSHLVFFEFSKIALPLILMFIFTILIVPIITIMVCSSFGYKKRTAFMTGMGLAQVSEFSLIIAIQGKNLGHITDEILTLTIWLALITMGTTAYFIKFDDYFYRKLRKFLSFFELFKHHAEKTDFNIDKNLEYQIVLIGYDRMGYHIFKTLAKLNIGFIVVDINPDVIKKLDRLNIPCIYGDIGDPELYEKLQLKDKGLIISTVPDYNDSKLLIKKAKAFHKDVNIFVTALFVEEALDLYDAGADYVMIPHHLGGEHAAIIVEDISQNFDKMMDKKLSHINDLRGRRTRHPHHR